MPSPEDFNRLNKALEIASWLVGGGRHSAEAATANEVGWAITMQTLRDFGAEFEWDYVPSEKTRREVVRIMEMFEERAAVCQAAHNLSQTLAKDREHFEAARQVIMGGTGITLVPTVKYRKVQS